MGGPSAANQPAPKTSWCDGFSCFGKVTSHNWNKKKSFRKCSGDRNSRNEKTNQWPLTKDNLAFHTRETEDTQTRQGASRIQQSCARVQYFANKWCSESLDNVVVVPQEEARRHIKQPDDEKNAMRLQREETRKKMSEDIWVRRLKKDIFGRFESVKFWLQNCNFPFLSMNCFLNVCLYYRIVFAPGGIASRMCRSNSVTAWKAMGPRMEIQTTSPWRAAELVSR